MRTRLFLHARDLKGEFMFSVRRHYLIVLSLFFTGVKLVPHRRRPCFVLFSAACSRQITLPFPAFAPVNFPGCTVLRS